MKNVCYICDGDTFANIQVVDKQGEICELCPDCIQDMFLRLTPTDIDEIEIERNRVTREPTP